MIVVTCTCGARLKAPPAAAGKRVKCPRCAGKIPVPPAAPAVRESEPAPLDLLEGLSSGVAAAAQARKTSEDDLYGFRDDPAPHAPAQPIAAAAAAPVALVGYARDDQAARAHAAGARAARDVLQGPRRGFWLDVLYAFAYPVARSGNAVNFGFIAVLVVFGAVCRFAGMLGLFARFIIWGYLASVYMSVVTDTAAGEDDMPGLKMEEGWLGDIVVPAITFAATFVLAMLPALVYVALILNRVVQPDPLVFALWTLFGIFLWPMIMLLFALGVWRMIFRPDLLLVTLAQSILPYLAVWAALLVSFGVQMIFTFGTLLLQFGIDVTQFVPSVLNSLGGFLAREVVGVYLTLVSMRIIGLYYLHFKKRFAFKLE